jgi:hypothetical protein
MLTRLSKLFSRYKKQRSNSLGRGQLAKPRRFAPQIEMLEAREVPSTVSDGAITGIDNEVIDLKFNAGRTQLSVYSNGNYEGAFQGPTFGFTAGISITASGGSNTITFDDSGYFYNDGGTYLITTNALNQQQLDTGYLDTNGSFRVLYQFTFTNNLFVANLNAAWSETGTDNVHFAASNHTLAPFTSWNVQGDPYGPTNDYVDASNDPGGNTYNIVTTGVTSSQGANVSYNNISSLTFYSPDNTSTVNVNATSPGLSTLIYGNSYNGTYNIGNGELDNIQGPVTLTITPHSGATRLNVNDQVGQDSGNTYSIYSDNVLRPNFGGLTYSGVQSLTLNGDAADNVFDINSTSAMTTINAGASNATFDVGFGNLNTLQGTLTLNATGGGNALEVSDDRSTFQGTYSISASGLTGNGATLSYSDLQGLTFQGSNGNDSYDIGGGNLSTLGSVEVGTGGLQATTSSNPSTPLNVAANVGIGTNSLVVDDSDNHNASTYTITSDNVTGQDFGGLLFFDVNSLTLDGSWGSTFNVTNTSLPTTLNTSGSSTSNSINVGGPNANLDSIRGPLSVNNSTRGTPPTTLNLDDHGAGFQGAYTITSNSISRPGSFAGVTFSGVQAVTLTGSSDDTFDVASTSAPTTLIGSGPVTTFNVGNGSLDSITGPVTVQGLSGSAGLVVDDRYGGSTPYGIGANSITRQGFGGLTFSGVQNVTLDAATAGIHTFEIGNGNLQGIGSVLVNGSTTSGSIYVNEPGNTITVNSTVDSVILDDHQANFTGSYTITPDTVTGDAFGGLTYVALPNLTLDLAGGSTINVAGSSATTTINAGGIGTINVTGTFLPLTINCAQGDTVNVGTGDLGGLQGPVTINGSGIVDHVVLSDSTAGFSGTYTVTGNSVTRSGFGGLTYNNVGGGLTLDGATGNSTFLIGNGNLSNLPRYLAINGGSGTNSLVLDDHLGNSPYTYYIQSGTVSLPAGGLVYGGVQSLTVEGGSNIYQVAATSVPVTLNGSGNSTFVVGHGTLLGIHGSLTVNGKGSDALTIDEGSTNLLTTYTITSDSVTRPGFALNYVGVQSLTLDGSFDGSVNVASTSAPTTVNAGADGTINITGTSLPTTINTAQFDQVNVGSGDLGALRGLVTIKGNGYADFVAVNDSTSGFSGTYAVTGSSVMRPGFAGLTYTNLGQTNGGIGLPSPGLTLDGATGGDQYNIGNTISRMTVNGGGSNDTFDVTSANALLVLNESGSNNTFTLDNGLSAEVQVNGGGLYNDLVLKDNLSNYSGSYTITGPNYNNGTYGEVLRTGFGGVFYYNVVSLTVDGATGGDQYNISNEIIPMTINGGGGNDTFDLANSSAYSVTLNGGGSNDTFILDNGLSGHVTVNGTGSNNTVIVKDNLDTSSAPYVINQNNVSWNFASLYYTSVQSLELDGASGGGYQYTITDANVPTTVNTSGSNDTFNIYSPVAPVAINGGGSNGIFNVVAPYSPVTINGGGSNESVILRDNFSNLSGPYTITSGEISRNGYGGLFYKNVQSLEVDGATGGDVYNVNSTSEPTTIKSGGVGDMFILGDGDLGNLQGPVTITGGGAPSTVVVNDNLSNYSGPYSITSGEVTRNGFGGLIYSNVQNVEVDGATGGDQYAISNTNGVTIVNGGGSNDTFDVTAADAPLIINGSGSNDTFVLDNGLAASVFVNGSGSNNAVILKDNLSNYAGPYTITSGEVSRNGFAGLFFGNVQSLELDGATGGDVYNVNSTSVPTTITSGGGQDTFNLGTGDLGALPGPVTIHDKGAAGLVLNDQNAGTTTYTVAFGSVTRNGFGGVNYDGVGSLTVDGSNNADAYYIGSSSVPTVLNGGGNGNSYLLGDKSIIDLITGSGSLDNITAPVTIHGSGANDSVSLDDIASSFQGTYTISASSVSRAGFGGLIFGNVHYLSLRGTKNGDVYNVLGTSAQTNLDSGGSQDLFHVSGLSNLVLAYGSGAVNFAPVSWTLPTAIPYGTPLSTTQLNATASVPGSLTYTPALGAILPVGNQVLSVAFAPMDPAQYNTVTAYVPILITPAATQAAIAASSDPSVDGQMVTFTASVSAQAPSSATPSGSVQFQVDGMNLGSPLPLSSSGTVTSPGIAFSIGNHAVTAVYLDSDGNFLASSGTLAGGEQVNPASTQTVLSSTIDPSVYGQSVTLTATVSAISPGIGMPIGTITFMDGNNILGTQTLTGATATFMTSALGVGSHSITAVYCGDANDLSSTSQAVTQTVDEANTATVLNPSVASVFGQGVTFTAVVSVLLPGSGTPNFGTVTFFDSGKQIGTGTVSGGVATYATSALSVGAHTITASYGGDGTDFLGSPASTAVTQVVNRDSTTTKVASSANPSVFGQKLTILATVTANLPGSGTPVGTVTFKVNGNAQPAVKLNAQGQAVFVFNPPVGNYAITATYNGGPNFTVSTSPALHQVVNKDATTVALVSSRNPSTSGQQVVFTATVSAAAPGSGTPFGTVEFLDGTTVLGFHTLSAGQSSFTTSSLSVGIHSITAKFLGDSSFNPQTSAVLTQSVRIAGTVNTALSSTDRVIPPPQGLGTMPNGSSLPGVGTSGRDAFFIQAFDAEKSAMLADGRQQNLPRPDGTYHTAYADNDEPGSSFDWFWAAYAQDYLDV